MADNLMAMLLNYKIFLQDCQTGKFMRADSIWTVDINEAFEFPSVLRATSFGMKQLTEPFHVVEIEANKLQIPISCPIEKQQIRL